MSATWRYGILPRFGLVLAIVLGIPPAAVSMEPAAEWESLGPEGGFFPHFLIHPTSDNVVLAGSDDSGGIWKSTNGGNSWRLVTEELRNATGWWLAVDPVNSEVLYATDLYGRHPLIRSIDGGENWTEIGQGLTARRTTCLVIDPKSAKGAVCRTLYLGTGFDQDRPGDGVFKSTDAGASWGRAGLKGQTVPYLRMTPVGTLLAGTTTGLFRSTDGGATWIGLGLAGHLIWDIIVESEDGEQTVYCGTLGNPNGVLKTTDAGKTWTPASEGLIGKWVIGMEQAKDSTLFCSNWTNEGIFRSPNRAASWTAINKGLHATYVTGLTIDPQSPDRIWVSCLGAYSAEDHALAPTLWQGQTTPDDGVRWHRINGLKATTYLPAVSPTDPNRILFGTFQKGVYFSRDGGQTLEPVIDKHVCVATAFAGKESRVGLASVVDFATGSVLLFRSDDAGENWVSKQARFGASRLVAETGSDRVWAAANDGAYVSDDAGLNWRRGGLRGHELKTVALAEEGKSVFAGGRSFLAFSRDRGTTWQEISDPPWLFDCEVREIIASPTDPRRLYVGVNGAEIKLANQDVARGGVWTTADGGETWKDMSADLPNDHVWGVALSQDGRTLYVGTYGGGVFRLSVHP